MDRARGFDCSGYQPSVSWATAYAGGMRFAGIKATEGQHHVDSALLAHRDGFRAVPGFLLGIYYHFVPSAKPGELSDPVRQARALVAAVGPLEPRERLCLDLERHPDPAHPAKSLAWIDAFYTELLGGACGGRRPVIYTSARVWREMGNPVWVLASEIDLWVPRYPARLPLTPGVEPVVPSPWASAGWTCWQWTNGKTIDNITPGVGRCDANLFCGDEAALAAYAARTLG